MKFGVLVKKETKEGEKENPHSGQNFHKNTDRTSRNSYMPNETFLFHRPAFIQNRADRSLFSKNRSCLPVRFFLINKG